MNAPHESQQINIESYTCKYFIKRCNKQHKEALNLINSKLKQFVNNINNQLIVINYINII